MKVTLEQIDELRSRVNVTYEEAKKTLEKNDGDLIKSIIELENKKDKKYQRNSGGFTSFVDKLLQLRFSVKSKDGDTLVNVPVVLVLLTFIMAFWIVIFGIILAIITSCKIRIYRDKNSIDVHGIKRNMKETVEKIKVKSEEIIEKEEDLRETDDNDDSDDSDENEVIIE